MHEPGSPEPVPRLSRPSEQLLERKLVSVPDKDGRNFPFPVYQQGNAFLDFAGEPRQRSRKLEGDYFFRGDFSSVKPFKVA
jgi:hypothetical protein